MEQVRKQAPRAEDWFSGSRRMASSQDTEVTLGTGKMLVLFFGLVVVCAVFFGLGFSIGRNSAKSETGSGDAIVSPAAANPAVRPSGMRSTSPTSSSSDQLTFYKSVAQKNANPQMATKESESGSSTPEENAGKHATPNLTAAPPQNGYYVQVAAVSKQEDAEALVGALKKKQYAAFAASNSPSDKLFHVQVGPFADIQDAETSRSKLISDGYNPILKK